MKKRILITALILVSIFASISALACNRNEENDDHTHSYVWNHDTAYHWKECECNDIDEATKTIHQFKYILNEEYHWQKCECGYTLTKTAHSYDAYGICACGSTIEVERPPYTMEDVAGVYYLWVYSGRDGGYELDKNRTIEIFADGTIEWGLLGNSITKTYELKGYTIQINYENELTDETESDVFGIRDNIICFTYEYRYYNYYQAYLCKEGVNPNKEYGDLYYSVGLDGNYCIIGLKNTEVRSITIPSVINKVDVTSIGSYAFDGRNNLTEVIIPEGITTIGQYAFNACSGLTNIVIPNSVTSIGREAFFYCKSMESVTIGNGVTEMGDKAFCKCYYLKSVSIGSCEVDISYYLFERNGNLESIEASEDNKRYYVENNCLIERETKTLVLGCKSSVIPDDVTSIGDYAFTYSDIESLTIPDSVMSVGNYAFYNCIFIQYNRYDYGYYLGNELNPYLVLVKADKNYLGMTACIVHNDTKIICSHAFANCSKLESVTIGNNVTSIGDYAFQYCSNLKSITIPDSVTSIGDRAFDGSTALESVYYKGSAKQWNAITIGASNNMLTSATVYYYSEEEPQDGGNYWHYDDDGVTPVIW